MSVGAIQETDQNTEIGAKEEWMIYTGILVLGPVTDRRTDQISYSFFFSSLLSLLSSLSVLLRQVIIILFSLLEERLLANKCVQSSHSLRDLNEIKFHFSKIKRKFS